MFSSKCDVGGFDQGLYLVSGLVFYAFFEDCNCLTDKMDGDFLYCGMLGESTYCTHIMWPLIGCFKSADNNLLIQRTCNVVGLCPCFQYI